MLHLIAALLAICQMVTAATIPVKDSNGRIAPKVLIVSMFEPEAEIWYKNMPGSGLGDLLAVNISTPGLSMLYPHVHCVADYSVCQYSTLGGVAIARYAVQVLQYELDAREMPENFTTGYFPYGKTQPNQYAANQYGTEVMELNENLREIAYALASKAHLADSDEAAQYRARYKSTNDLAAATLGPSVVKCDTATSDVYYSGKLLSEGFENITEVWTNGTGRYCMTAQEDSAALEVLVRMAVWRLVDFARVIVMRTGSNFDRPPPDVSAYEHLAVLHQNGFRIAIQNLFNAGVEIVKGILEEWDSTFENGIKPSNYIGDVFGSLGGQPDFGPGSLTGGKGVVGGVWSSSVVEAREYGR
ncbi:purine nucleoside permease-domain-containing protein [Podospora aff. communis PSN243]|uniref:Purine nucleoside permease-domain-containing protein n=1 Tax=Podospora aff. communis PSN243 TaxID=3040156 RepID=A0AAV9GAS9_9PEZI|nr:purine nucleoside permease-domain-containing protein [Podospora aff. communis PSN243]